MNSRRYSLIVLLATLLAGGFGLHASAADKEPVWIDVRTAEELAHGYLEGTHHIPHDEIAGRISEVTTDKEQPIHLFCRSGKRSQIALEALRDMGYKNLHNEGSFEDAVAARPDLETECPAC